MNYVYIEFAKAVWTRAPWTFESGASRERLFSFSAKHLDGAGAGGWTIVREGDVVRLRKPGEPGADVPWASVVFAIPAAEAAGKGTGK